MKKLLCTQNSVLINLKSFIMITLFISVVYSQENSGQTENNFHLDENLELQSSAITTEFNYNADLFSNLKGGISKGTKFINQFQFAADLELNKFFNINKTVIHASLVGVKGNAPNDLIGSTQGVSNIETENILKLYDLWIDYEINKNSSILLGLFDVNSEFDTKYNSLLFINPSHGIGAEFGLTGKNGPSIYPNTSLGFRLNHEFGHDNYIKLGAFDAVPGTEENPYSTNFDFGFSDGLLLISEFGYDCYSDFEVDSETSLCINFALGAWYFTNKYDEFLLDKEQKGNFGFYSFFESRIHKFGENTFLSAFVRTGLADPNVNQIHFYFSGGFVLLNIFAEEDQLGFGFASANNSRKFSISQNIINEYPAQNETNFELTYLVNVTDYFSLQPDLQYFINPGNCSYLQDSFCAGLRTSFTF